MDVIGVVNILTLSGESVGTGFFVSSEGYLLTCRHVLDAGKYDKVGEIVSFKYATSSLVHKAIWIDSSEEKDLALLRADEKAENYLSLRERCDYDLKADSYGFPSGSNIEIKASVHIDRVFEDGKKLQLGNANSITFGFSGAPLIYDGTAIGMVVNVTRTDSNVRMTEIAFAVTAKCILQAFPQYLKQIVPQENAAVSRYTKKELIQPITLREFGLLANTYVERTELLNRMKYILGMPMQEKNYVYLSGIGGEGKSELARAYAFREKDVYQEIFWLTCEMNSLPDLMELFGKSHYMKASISREEAEQLDERSLIIVDNCNNLTGEFLYQIASGTGKAKVVFTTRLTVVECDPDYKDHMLRVISDDPEKFALAVFEKNLQNREIKSNEIYSVKRICRRVGCHPMAVSMLARNLSTYRKNCSFFEFYNELEKGFPVALPRYTQLPFSKDEVEDNRSFYSAIEHLFHDFLSHDFSLLERQILSLFCLMPFKEYKKEYIFSLLGDDIMNTAIETACYGLVSKGWISENGEYLSMHPLIAEVMNEDNGKKEMCIISDPSFYMYLLKNWLVMLPEIGEDYSDIMLVCLSKIENAAKTESENDYLFLAVKAILAHYRIQDKFMVLDYDNSAELLAKMQGDITRAHRFTRALKKFRIKIQNVYPTLSFGFTAIAEYEYGIDYMYYDLESQQEHMILELHNRRLYGGYWGTQESERHSYAMPMRVYLKEFLCKKETVHYSAGFNKTGLADLNFPDTLFGCNITEIPEKFCMQCCIKSLHLPSGLSEIGTNAFAKCAGLEGKIDFPGSMEKIGENAFADCSSITEVHLPNGITEISDNVFHGCVQLSIIELPEYLISVGKGAFDRCSFSELVLPDRLSSIGENAFSGCPIKDITIPSSVVSIGRGAFSGCPLKDITIPNTVTDYREINFSDCSSLIDFVIPESVTDISYINFNRCKALRSFSFPKNIDYEKTCYVGFENCSSITKIELPEGLKQINGQSFSYCSNLEEILIPDSVSEIGKKAFFGCSKLKSIKLPTQLRQIGECVFAECSKLKSIKLPTQLRQIGDGVFAGCTSLETISIPSTVEEFNWQAIPYDNVFTKYPPQRYVYFPEGANLKIFQTLHGGKLWINVIDLTHPPEIFPNNVQTALCRGYLLAVEKQFQIPKDIKDAYDDFIRKCQIPRSLIK